VARFANDSQEIAVSRQFLVPGAFALAMCFHSNAWCATDAELAEIRAQIRELKSQYESRIDALEQRLKKAEARAAVPAPVAMAPPPEPMPSSSASSSLAAFNPAISAILNGTYANLSHDPRQFAIAGFAPGGDAGPGRRGFGLGESELVFSANVDPRFAANLTVSLTPENTVAVEEAYGLWLTAPYGLVPKFGRFFSGIGYMNEQHAHAWDFVDAPLAYQAFLGTQFSQDGVQVKWLAPTEHFIELGAEAGNGAGYPGGDRSANAAGAAAIYAHTGGDIGESHSWRAGLSQLRTRGDDLDPEARSRVSIADFVWKYAPNGNTRQTNFKLQGEYFTGRLRDQVSRSGWYLQGVYQFMPEWRAGLRYDRLDSASTDFRPDRYSVMVDYSPSEFSRFRLQYAQAKLLPEVTDHQLFVQYILSLGAHGAHKY
jgi:hypothetical protein